jgi:hypothetical protein
LFLLPADQQPRLLAQLGDPVSWVANRDATIQGEFALREIALLEVRQRLRPSRTILIVHASSTVKTRRITGCRCACKASILGGRRLRPARSSRLDLAFHPLDHAQEFSTE